MGFPSDKYMLGVSTDGALTMSPPMEATYMEYAANFKAGGMVSVPESVLQAVGPTFTASAWVYLDGETTGTRQVRIFQF